MARLVDLLRQDDALLATVVDESQASSSRYSALLRQGPRLAGHATDLELVFEAVHEGYLLHHRRPRIVNGDDPDLALLAGDRLYAIALERLAVAGDIESVRALADAIALCAQAHAAEDEDLADAVWEAAASEVGWGPAPALTAAKEDVRAGKGKGGERLRQSARGVRNRATPAG